MTLAPSQRPTLPVSLGIVALAHTLSEIRKLDVTYSYLSCLSLSILTAMSRCPLRTAPLNAKSTALCNGGNRVANSCIASQCPDSAAVVSALPIMGVFIKLWWRRSTRSMAVASPVSAAAINAQTRPSKFECTTYPSSYFSRSCRIVSAYA